MGADAVYTGEFVVADGGAGCGIEGAAFRGFTSRVATAGCNCAADCSWLKCNWPEESLVSIPIPLR